jgi:hypothetical protein
MQLRQCRLAHEPCACGISRHRTHARTNRLDLDWLTDACVRGLSYARAGYPAQRIDWRWRAG